MSRSIRRFGDFVTVQHIHIISHHNRAVSSKLSSLYHLAVREALKSLDSFLSTYDRNFRFAPKRLYPPDRRSVLDTAIA